MASLVASTLLQPWAMLANGPPWMKAGLPPRVCTRLGLQGVLEQDGHGAVGLQVGGRDGPAVAGVGHDDAPQPLAEFAQRFGEAEDGHHFGGHGDVEAALAGHAVGHAAQPHHDAPQGPVVHVHHPLPHDAPRVDAQLVAVVDVVVQHGGQQVVGQLDGVEVAGEMEVDVLHGHHLRIAAAGRPALHAEAGPQRRLAEADRGPLADAVEPVGQADAGGGFAFAGRGGRDGRHQDQLPRRPVGQPAVKVQGDLGLVLAVMHQVVAADTQLGGHLVDGQHAARRAISMSGGRGREASGMAINAEG